MADALQLICLVEGNGNISYIRVPYISYGQPATVVTLRNLVFEKIGKDLTSYETNLIVFKIDVGLDEFDDCEKPFHLFRFNVGDKDVEQLSPRQRIDEIWREPPPAHHISVFVKCTELFEQVAAHRQLVENVQLVYDRYWGKDFSLLLEDVPGHDNLQYLPTSQIDPGLQSLFCPKILPIHKDYKDLYKTFQSYWKGPRKLCDGVVITNQSRIEKSYPLYYLLLCLLKEKKTVAFHAGHKFVLFQDTGVDIYDITDMMAILIPKGTWALTDSWSSSEQPCPAFMAACRARNAWLVQSSCQMQEHELWESWRKKLSIVMHELEPMSSDELIALGLKT